MKSHSCLWTSVIQTVKYFASFRFSFWFLLQNKRRNRSLYNRKVLSPEAHYHASRNIFALLCTIFDDNFGMLIVFKRVRVMVFNATFNNISAILWRSVLLEKETRSTRWKPLTCRNVCQWLATGRWFSPGFPVSSTNKTDRHDITEILLKVALNIIKQTNKHKCSHTIFRTLYITISGGTITFLHAFQICEIAECVPLLKVFLI
jgi:hypothetical protein